MKRFASLLSLVAALPAVRGAAFAGPTPTALFPERALDGTTPKPTIPPSNAELKKRQSDLGPETCGWVDGVYSLAVTCPGTRTCMLYTPGAGMAGCCDGTNTVDCGWASSCIDAAAYKTSGCGTNCLLNNFIRKCTESARPYCVTWSYPSDSVLDYGCGANSDSSISRVLQRATDAFGATTSMTLPTVAANPATTHSTSSGTTRRKKVISIGVIIGIVIVALFLIFCISIAILFLIKKKKKQAQIAASAQAMAAVQSTRPQSQFPPPQHQTYAYPTPQQHQPPQSHMHQPSLFSPPIGQHTPVSPTPGYYPPAHREEKSNAYVAVHECADTPVSPPISSPSTPAPVYAQPHGVPPPVPAVPRYQVHEVDTVSVPHVAGQTGVVHEMGSGK